MIAGFSTWLMGILAASLVLSLLEAVTPHGAIKGVMKLTGGVVILLVLLQPLTTFRLEELEWRYQLQEETLEQQIMRYRDGYLGEMEIIIAQKTAAYISDKAAQLGICCCAEVETELRNTVPVPVAVRLDVPRENSLSQWIENELGISREQQYWEEDK